MVNEHEDEADQWWDDLYEPDPKPTFRARVRARVADWRLQWQPSVTVAAVEYAHRPMMQDEPMLRSFIDRHLMVKLAEQYPLRWRYEDLRWHVRQTLRALRGHPTEQVPWAEVVNVEMFDESTALFERNVIAIRAEKRRRPRPVDPVL